MTVPQRERPAADPWAAYADALGRLHAARGAAVTAHRAARRVEAERADELTRLTDRLAEQQHALMDLAARVRAPLTAADLAPAAVPGCPPAEAAADLRRRVDA